MPSSSEGIVERRKAEEETGKCDRSSGSKKDKEEEDGDRKEARGSWRGE